MPAQSVSPARSACRGGQPTSCPSRGIFIPRRRAEREQLLFSNELSEPPHVHIKAGGDQAKFWLDPIELEWNFGFNIRELNQIEGMIEENAAYLLEKWNEYFGD